MSKVTNTISKRVQALVDELPFLAVMAATNTARDAQQEVLAELPGRFTLRTSWWKPQSPLGFRLEMATKEKPVAAVYTTAPFMQLQETGGVKRPQGGSHLALPTTQVRRTKRDLIRKDQRPRAISKAFKIKKTNGEELLAVRIGRGKQSELRILYTLEQQANIPARLHFYETVTKVAKASFQGNVEKAWAYVTRNLK